MSTLHLFIRIQRAKKMPLDSVCISSANNTTHCSLIFPTAMHCDDKKSRVVPLVEVTVPKTKRVKKRKKEKQCGEVEANEGGEGAQALENGGQDSTPSFVFTIFGPLTPCHLWIGKKTSTGFAEKMKRCAKEEFLDEELECFQMHPGNLYMFSGDFPHAGGNYSELNVREFFRVYTSDRPGSNHDQHYFEVRKVLNI